MKNEKPVVIVLGGSTTPLNTQQLVEALKEQGVGVVGGQGMVEFLRSQGLPTADELLGEGEQLPLGLQEAGDELADKTIEKELQDVETQRVFAERVDKWLDFALDHEAFEYHEMAQELNELLLIDSKTTLEKLPKGTAYVDRLKSSACHKMGVIVPSGSGDKLTLVQLDRGDVARLIAINPNMARSLKLATLRDGEQVWSPRHIVQPRAAEDVFEFEGWGFYVHGLDRNVVPLQGSEYNVLTEIFHDSFKKAGDKQFITVGKHGGENGLYTYEEMIKRVFADEDINRVYAMDVMNGKIIRRPISIQRELNYITLNCGCDTCDILLATAAISLKPRGTY